MASKNVEVYLSNVRLSFEHLLEPQIQDSKDRIDPKTGEPVKDISYNCVLLVRKDDEAQVNKLKDALREALAGTWPGQKKTIPADRRCLRDGEPADPDTGERAPLYDGYAGCFALNAKKKVRNITDKRPVKVIGPRKTLDKATGKRSYVELTMTNGGPDLIYSGCYVNAIVRIYGYDGSKDGNPDRLNASIEVVQHFRDGERFGASSIDADEVMAEVEGEDEMPEAAPEASGGDDDLLG